MGRYPRALWQALEGERGAGHFGSCRRGGGPALWSNQHADSRADWRLPLPLSLRVVHLMA